MKRQKIKVSGKLSSDEKRRLGLSTPENYEEVIWNSIAEYNYRGQLDIANVLFGQLLELSKKLPDSHPVLKNIGLRILQLYLEVADQFALVCMAILSRHQKPVYETYMESDNVDTRKFFKRCAADELTDGEVKQIWGLNFAKKAKITVEERRARLFSLVKEIVDKERGNMKQFGSTYSKFDKISGEISYTSTVKGGISIKHAFKMLHPSYLAKEIWDVDEKTPTVLQEIRDIDFGKEGIKSLIVLGSMFEHGSESLKGSCAQLLRLIKFLSEEIKAIATIHEKLPGNPFFAIAVLSKGLIKIGRNEKCFCGSGKKYKKCHYLE